MDDNILRKRTVCFKHRCNWTHVDIFKVNLEIFPLNLRPIISNNVQMFQVLKKLDLLLNLLKTLFLRTVNLNPLNCHWNPVVYIETPRNLTKRAVSQKSILFAFDRLGQKVFLRNFLFLLNLILIVLLFFFGKVSHLKVLILLMKLSKQFLMDQLSWVHKKLRFVLKVDFFGWLKFGGFVSAHSRLQRCVRGEVALTEFPSGFFDSILTADGSHLIFIIFLKIIFICLEFVVIFGLVLRGGFWVVWRRVCLEESEKWCICLWSQLFGRLDRFDGWIGRRLMGSQSWLFGWCLGCRGLGLQGRLWLMSNLSFCRFQGFVLFPVG